jgi:hypothetical protein
MSALAFALMIIIIATGAMTIEKQEAEHELEFCVVCLEVRAKTEITEETTDVIE